MALQKTILIQDKLFDELRELRSRSDDLSAILIPFSLDFGLERALRKYAPDALILDVQFPPHGGIVTCERLKKSGRGFSPIVILVSEVRSKALVAGARAAECDFILENSDEASSKIHTFLRSKWKTWKESEEKTRPPRFAVSTPVEVILDNRVHLCQVLNASHNGLLFSSKDPIPEGSHPTIIFPSDENMEIQFQAHVTRQYRVKTPKNGFLFYIAARFYDSNEVTEQRDNSVISIDRSKDFHIRSRRPKKVKPN